MWERYCEKVHLKDEVYEAWAFGAEPDQLAELVLQGVKTATSSLYVLYDLEKEPLPKTGEYSVILDARGDAKCVVKTTSVYIVPFNKVSSVHAYKEGEGDRSLAYWQNAHREFFANCLEEIGSSFSETMDVVCEEFEVVYTD